VCNNIAAQSVETDVSTNWLECTITEELYAYTRNAPPAALLVPGLQELDFVKAMQLLNLV
jgi:hypothetical protein